MVKFYACISEEFGGNRFFWVTGNGVTGVASSFLGYSDNADEDARRSSLTTNDRRDTRVDSPIDDGSRR